MFITKFMNRRHSLLTDVGLLSLRLTLGSLLMGHGAQKLFGWFGGPGLEGTAEMMASLRLRPSRPWAMVAGGCELGGGLLTALGFLTPLGQLAVLGVMGVASATAHVGKPIWVTSGGAELPLTNIAAATTVMPAGPGRFSLDEVLGTRLPAWTLVPGLAAVGAGIALALATRAPVQPREEVREQPAAVKPGPEVVSPT
jgi:putative oxidoreductase